MKKISILAVMLCVIAPGYAETTENTTISLPDEVITTVESTNIANDESVTNVVAVTQANGSTNVVQYAEEPVKYTAVTETATPKYEKVKYTEHKTNYDSDDSFLTGVKLGAGVSATGGLDAFVGYNNKNFDSFWWKRFGIRLGYATTKPVKSAVNSATDKFMDDGIDIGDNLTVYNGEITAKQMFAMLDFYPFGNTWFLGGWRLSAGYYDGNIKVDANLTTDANNAVPGEFELNGHRYRYTNSDDKALATAKWKYSGPYIGTGFDFGLFAGIKLYVDAGLVFANNNADVDLDVPTNSLQEFNGATWGSSSNFSQDYSAALDDAQHELSKLDWVPVVKAGIMYRF